MIQIWIPRKAWVITYIRSNWKFRKWMRTWRVLTEKAGYLPLLTVLTISGLLMEIISTIGIVYCLKYLRAIRTSWRGMHLYRILLREARIKEEHTQTMVQACRIVTIDKSTNFWPRSRILLLRITHKGFKVYSVVVIPLQLTNL